MSHRLRHAAHERALDHGAHEQALDHGAHEQALDHSAHEQALDHGAHEQALDHGAHEQALDHGAPKRALQAPHPRSAGRGTRRGSRRGFLALALAVGAPILLAHCAMRRARAPGPARSEAPRQAPPGEHPGRGLLPPPSGEVAALRGWEAQQQAQVLALARLVRATPLPGGGVQRLAPVGPPARPDRTPSVTETHRPAPSPGASPAPPHPTRRQAAATRSSSSGRCQRICRHVAAICYATRRICSIAAALAEPAADAACRRGRDRCAEAKRLASSRCGVCSSRP